MLNGLGDFFPCHKVNYLGDLFPSCHPAEVNLCGKPGRAIKCWFLRKAWWEEQALAPWGKLGRARDTQGQHLPQQKTPHRGQPGSQTAATRGFSLLFLQEYPKFPRQVLGQLCNSRLWGQGWFWGEDSRGEEQEGTWRNSAASWETAGLENNSLPGN